MSMVNDAGTAHLHPMFSMPSSQMDIRSLHSVDNGSMNNALDAKREKFVFCSEQNAEENVDSETIAKKGLSDKCIHATKPCSKKNTINIREKASKELTDDHCAAVQPTVDTPAYHDRPDLPCSEEKGLNGKEEIISKSEIYTDQIQSDINCNFQFCNSNCAACDTQKARHSSEVNCSDDERVKLHFSTPQSIKSNNKKLFILTVAKPKIFHNSGRRRRRFLPFKLMGNSNSNQSSKKQTKKEKVARTHSCQSRKSVNCSAKDQQQQSVTSLPVARKRQHQGLSEYQCRLSGNYDSTSVLSSQEVFSPNKDHDSIDQFSAGKVKSPRLNNSQRSSSTFSGGLRTNSTQDFVSHKSSLLTEFDFTSHGKVVTTVPRKSDDGVDSYQVLSNENDAETDSAFDSTLVTLQGVCCAISNLQEKIDASNDIQKSEVLNVGKYSGVCHPSVNPAYPILSTRTPISPAHSAYNSPVPRSPAEPASLKEESENIEMTYKINPDMLPNVTTLTSTSNIEDNASSPILSTVHSESERQHSNPDVSEKSTQKSAIQQIMASKGGFEGSLLQSWLLSDFADESINGFVENFCNILVRSRVIVAKRNMEDKKKDEENVSTEGKQQSKVSTIFNRLKFMPTQIYTWGPFSRLNPRRSPVKPFTYRDFARRQVEINPTLSPSSAARKALTNGKEEELGKIDDNTSASQEEASTSTKTLNDDTSKNSIHSKSVELPTSEGMAEDIPSLSNSSNGDKKTDTLSASPCSSEEVISVSTALSEDKMEDKLSTGMSPAEEQKEDHVATVIPPSDETTGDNSPTSLSPPKEQPIDCLVTAVCTEKSREDSSSNVTPPSDENTKNNSSTGVSAEEKTDPSSANSPSCEKETINCDSSCEGKLEDAITKESPCDEKTKGDPLIAYPSCQNETANAQSTNEDHSSENQKEVFFLPMTTGTNASKKLGNVWPPPKPEEEDDDPLKLKYTEAEHQHELAVLKRNHTDELYKITKDYETNIYEINEEHTLEIEAMQQEADIMRQDISYLKGLLNRDKHDASTQTQNVAQLRLSKGVQANLTGEMLPPPPQITLPKNENEARPGAAAPPPPPPPPPPPAPGVPPPPPPAPGIPPPPPIGGPPPPPGLPGFPKKDSPKRPPIEPRKPMKPLYWKRIQIPKKEFSVSKAVWVHVQDIVVDEEEMERTFCKKATTKKSKALSETITDKKKAMPAKVLDNKRSQAVGIFISSLHVEMEELQLAILNLDTSCVDEENMKSIFDLRGTKQEIQSIKSLLESQSKLKEEEKQSLDKPEKFLYSLSQIDHFDERMYCITFRASFKEDIQTLQKDLRNLNDTLQELRDKDTVLRVLGLVLSVGNYLNGGNRSRGQADGFQLDILSKLKDVKGEKDNASFSLLNYIAWVYMRTFDQEISSKSDICPVPTFQSVTLASQVNFTDISKELKRISKDLKDCDKKVACVVKKSKKEYLQPFKDIMELFLDNAYASLDDCKQELQETETRFQDAVEFFCMKSKTKTIDPKEFFGMWQPFCMDLHGIWSLERNRYAKDVARNAARKAEESRVRQMEASVTTSSRRKRSSTLKTRIRNAKT